MQGNCGETPKRPYDFYGASMKKIFIHKFKYSHSARRKQINTLLVRGLANVLEHMPEGTLYECDSRVFISRRGNLKLKR